MRRSMEDLLLLWEERRATGEPLTAAWLCSQSPEDAAKLKRRIDLLESLGKVLMLDLAGPPAPPRAGPLPNRIGDIRSAESWGVAAAESSTKPGIQACAGPSRSKCFIHRSRHVVLPRPVGWRVGSSTRLGCWHS